MPEPKSGQWPWERDPEAWQRAIDEVKAVAKADEEAARIEEAKAEMMKEAKITARFLPLGTAIEVMGSSVCFACRHGFYCVMIRAFVKGLKEIEAGYQEVVVDECSLYERNEHILGEREE